MTMTTSPGKSGTSPLNKSVATSVGSASSRTPSTSGAGTSNKGSGSTNATPADKLNTTIRMSFPVARIRTIMKSSPDVTNISQECVYTVAKATELFVSHLVNRLLKKQKQEGKNRIDYNDLANLVETNEALSFMADVAPQKIKASEWMRKYQHEFIDSEDDEEESEDDEEDEDDDESS